jgi:hypothetical protein
MFPSFQLKKDKNDFSDTNKILKQTINMSQK